jgi:ABC-type multidrug transport system fused ATPase/permease subunit
MIMDNNYVEAIGTGKMISIYSQGIKRWNELLSFLLRDTTRSLVVFIVTISILYSMNHLYGVIFLLIVICIHVLVAWIDGFARNYRKIRTEKRHDYSRKLVQIIMSKMDILQNNQIDERAGELTQIHFEIAQADDKVARSIFFIFNVPRIFIAIARIGILILIGYQVFG